MVYSFLFILIFLNSYKLCKFHGWYWWISCKLYVYFYFNNLYCFRDWTKLFIPSISLISFILLNWHPAKLFMGDSGSTFLAAINISLICMSNDFLEAFNLLLILSPLLIDPFICIKKIFYRQNIFLPHSCIFIKDLISRA